MKTCALVLAVALALGSVTAGAFPVFDSTNLVQNMNQVRQAIKQLKELERQLQVAKEAYNVAKSTHDAMTGSRGMGALVTDVARDYVPTNWRETLDMRSSTNSAFASRVDEIRGMAGNIGQMRLVGAPQSVLDAAENGANTELRAQASAAQMYDRANERFAEIGRLGQRIDTAPDQKAILDLMARVQVENANLQNEMIRQLALAESVEAERNMQGERDLNEHRAALSGLWSGQE